jgi:hypothetical protein
MYDIEKLTLRSTKGSCRTSQKVVHTAPAFFFTPKAYNPKINIKTLFLHDGLNCAVMVVNREKSIKTDLVTLHGFPTK